MLMLLQCGADADGETDILTGAFLRYYHVQFSQFLKIAKLNATTFNLLECSHIPKRLLFGEDRFAGMLVRLPPV